MIQVRALTKSIDTGTHRVEILKGIDLEIPRGQFAAIMGPSGSGKSTLLGLLAGLDTPTSGQVILDGEDITHLGEDDMALLRGRKIGFVFQSYHLISTLTAEENVLLPMELAGAEAGGRERARELLERVGLGGRSDHYPVQLSGGEQQRVALARAFALRPPILLADEPTGNLDSATGSAVLELLLALNREQGTTMVLVTHEQSLAESADRRIVLRDGLVLVNEPVNDAQAATLLARGHAHRLARDARLAREIPVRRAVGGHRRGVAHRSPRLQQFVPPHAAGRGAHPDGGRSDRARLRAAHTRSRRRRCAVWKRAACGARGSPRR